VSIFVLEIYRGSNDSKSSQNFIGSHPTMSTLKSCHDVYHGIMTSNNCPHPQLTDDIIHI